VDGCGQHDIPELGDCICRDAGFCRWYGLRDAFPPRRCPPPDTIDTIDTTDTTDTTEPDTSDTRSLSSEREASTPGTGSPRGANPDESETGGRHRTRRPWLAYGAAGAIYLALGFVLWCHAWASGASTHTLCDCGDPALFLWFFQWPATAIQHGQNPFYSTALFHPTGINLLAQTSVPAITIPLVPVTWIWGPVASLNVASTLTPALSALAAFAAVRRWAPWWPAAFVGGLLYGFSPFVLQNLEFAHLMAGALLVPPLILIALDEILVRQRHKAWTGGVALGALLLLQFFVSTEILAIIVMVAVVSIVVLVVGALLTDPAEVRRRARHAASGLAIGTAVGIVLLAWPTWFALDGPAHLSGAVWPNIFAFGGYTPSNFVQPDYGQGLDASRYIAGYEGAAIGSGGYLGWGMLAVLGGGLVAFRRDLRLCFFALVLVLCCIATLGWQNGHEELVDVLARLPVLDNVIVQRFMAVGFLAAAVTLGIIVDRIRSVATARDGPSPAPVRSPSGAGQDPSDSPLSARSSRTAGGDVARPFVQLLRRPASRRTLVTAGALAAAVVALAPIVTTFGPRLPYKMTSVILPRWYREVAPDLPPHQVLLAFPTPSAWLQSPLAWQAVNSMHYSQAGGGGPEGVAWRSGPARAGYAELQGLGFSHSIPLPTGTQAQRSAVRRTLEYWRVTTVVISTNDDAPLVLQGDDPAYAAAFMSATLGRLPKLEAGAWVWNDVDSELRSTAGSTGWIVGPLELQRCTAVAEGRLGRFARASMFGPDCVEHPSILSVLSRLARLRT
jgi:hypothetical protein